MTEKVCEVKDCPGYGTAHPPFVPVRVTIDLEVIDETLLRSYTSGLLPAEATLEERVTMLVKQHHPINPLVNGVGLAHG